MSYKEPQLVQLTARAEQLEVHSELLHEHTCGKVKGDQY